MSSSPPPTALPAGLPAPWMDLLLDAVCVVDAQGRFLFVSGAFERIFGYRPDEVLGRPMIELVHPEDRARTLAIVDELMAGEPKPLIENRYLRKDGRVVHILWSARWSEADQVRVAVARDISERKRAECKQAAVYAISEAAFASADLGLLYERIHQIIAGLLPAGSLAVALYDRGSDTLSFPYFVDEAGLTAPPPGTLQRELLSAEVIRSASPVLLSQDRQAGGRPQADVGGGGAALRVLGLPLISPQGVIGALLVKQYGEAGAGYSAADVELLQYVSTQIAAVILRKQMESWLQHIARHDTLTGLPNRALFQDRLDTALARARRDGGRIALLYLDLDRFKQVNDSWGHACGDQLLQAVAARLRDCVRESDTVGRLGGDEFVVLLHAVETLDQVVRLAEKIRQALGLPFELGALRLSISPSVGIAHHPEHGDEPGQLLRLADAAMYAAKRAGGNHYRVAELPDDS